MDSDKTPSPLATQPLIEIGCVLDGDFDSAVVALIEESSRQLQNTLSALFPAFRWRLSIPKRASLTGTVRSDGGSGSTAQPSALLLHGLSLIEQHRWDFAFVLTDRQLISHRRSQSVAMPSRSLGVAVISVNDLFSDLWQHGQSPESTEQAVDRLKALYVHLMGDLNGIEHTHDAEEYFTYPGQKNELDSMRHLSDESIRLLNEELADVADTRLEERPDYKLASRPVRYLKGIVHLRAEIMSAVRQAQPWEFPFRLSSLSTAAISTLLILTMTAETWELGMQQSNTTMAVFSLLVFALSSAYVLMKQKLVVGSGSSALTESRLIADTTIVLIVLLGMAITYGLLALLSLVLSAALFSSSLIASWAPSLAGPASLDRYLAVAQLVAAFGLAIGSLGSSFEGQSYFRHVAYVDEEL